MKETDSIKDLETQATNTKYLMDRLNRAAYGMTFVQRLAMVFECSVDELELEIYERWQG